MPVTDTGARDIVLRGIRHNASRGRNRWCYTQAHDDANVVPRAERNRRKQTNPVTDFRQDRGPLGPPPVVFRLPDRAGGLRRLGGWWRWAALAALLLVLYIAASIGKDIYADVLWFDSVGFRSVYVTRLTTRLWLFLAGGGAFFVLFLVNVWLARRLAPSADDPGFEVTPELHDLLQDLQSAPARRIATAAMIVVAALLSLAFAAAAAGEWQAVLLAQNAQ